MPDLLSDCHGFCGLILAMHHRHPAGLVRDIRNKIEQFALIGMGAVAVDLGSPILRRRWCQHSPALGHTGSADDYGRPMKVVELLGLFGAASVFEHLKAEGVFATIVQELLRLFVIRLRMLPEELGDVRETI